jgi:ABC-2 type transport system ATP-binding protein
MTTTSLSQTDAELAISVRGLRRSYGDFEAVRGVDLDVPAGTITALLGTNGAGKTSTLEVVEGLSRPSAGTVRVLGLDPTADRQEVRRRCGVLLQRSGFPGDLTVLETLDLWAATLSRPRPVDEALAMLSLDHRAGVRVSALSGGEQRRLDIACTLMGHPELVFLDEPTTGLDPESRRELWQLVRGLRDAGTTVVLCTHYLEEAETLADRLEIMHGGRIVRSGTPAEIADGHPSTISFRTPSLGLPDTGTDLAVRRVVESAGTTTLETDDLQHTLTVLLAAAERSGVRLEQLAARTASLESVFLEIADSATGRTDPDLTEEVAA